MRAFLWVWRIIGPIVMFAGIIYFAFVLFNPNWSDDVIPMDTTCIVGVVCAIIGIIIGFTGWVEDVPPRLFWIEGNVDLLDSRIGYAITLGLQMFFLPEAIILTVMLIDVI